MIFTCKFIFLILFYSDETSTSYDVIIKAGKFLNYL